MLYGLVIETDQIQEYWQPGRSYVVIGRNQMKQALDAMVKPLLDKDMALLEALFNPHSEGCATQVSIRKGPQAYAVDIQPLSDTSLPPIALGDWYQPLSQCWLPEAFNIKDYEEVLAAFTNNRI